VQNKPNRDYPSWRVLEITAVVLIDYEFAAA
jgi:hypothetical protein